MSRVALFQSEERWATYKAPEPLVEVRLPRPADAARETLRMYFGTNVDAAFMTPDRGQVVVYVAELNEDILDRVAMAEEKLAYVLGAVTELRVLAHQGRAFASHRDDMDRLI